MSQLTVNLYLIDENGAYVMSEAGEKIIVSTQSYDVDNSTRPLVSQRWGRRQAIHSFDVKKKTDTDWYVIINKHFFAGRYQSQSQSLGVVFGLYTSMNGHDDGFSTWIEDQVNEGISSIDPAINNISLTDLGIGQDPRLAIELSDFDAGGGFFPQLQIELSTDGVNFAYSPTPSGVAVTGDGTYNITEASYNLIPENQFFRYRLATADPSGQFDVLSTSNVLYKNDVPDSMTLRVSLSSSPNAEAGIQVGDFAYANTDVQGLAPDASVDLNYNWSREIASLIGIDINVLPDDG